MVSTPLSYQLLLVALVLICLLLHVVWPDDPPRAPTPSPQPHQRRRPRVKEPKPFPGSSTNRCAEPVNRQPRRSPRRRASHRRSSVTPKVADGLSTPTRTSVQSRIAPIMA